MNQEVERTLLNSDPELKALHDRLSELLEASACRERLGGLTII